MKYFVLVISIIIFTQSTQAHVQKDTSKPKSLQEILIKAWLRENINRMPDANNGLIATGKKNEVIALANVNANIAEKTGRQIFAKVPGVFVYDMDGSGNQVNVSTRGLDAHRSWENNIRQNMVLINSDMYGYPASHYSAPMESVERIEIIRGTASLQSGAQFGGLINYVTKRPDTSRSAGFESINTVGSFGLFSTYNAITGAINKKFSYYAYYYRRHSDGYRKNSTSNAEAQFVNLNYQFNKAVSLKAELGRSKYIYKIPGPLTDSMFHENPRQSTRSRNYFSPDIYIPSLTFDWIINNKTTFNITSSGVFGKRNSVQFDAFANIPDSIISSTGSYKNRQVDTDGFHSRTFEAKMYHEYMIGRFSNKLSGGIQYMNNDLHRQQLGKGTTGSDYDLSLVVPGLGRDLHFLSKNVAFFAENAFYVNSKWTVSPGFRYENGQSQMKGIISNYDPGDLPNVIKHKFPLFGISTQYNINKENIFYGGISEAYRPVIFKDIIPASTLEKADKNLKDAKGFNIEAGTRGKLFTRLQYDISYFHITYNNRLGTVVLQDNAGQPFIYRTNIGNSRTNGLEAYIQYKLSFWNSLFTSVYSSTAYFDARYIKGEIASGGTNKSIENNGVESVPKWISRNGIDINYKNFSSTFLYSYVSGSYSDAFNTFTPSANGARGYVPSYNLLDFNASLRVAQLYQIRFGINNIFNKQYFTKRPTFYPGPGIWPSDGRALHLQLV